MAGRESKARRDTKPEDVPARITANQWRRFLDLIAAGVKRAEAEADIGANSVQVQTYLATQNKARSQYEEARLIWVRRDMDHDAIEAILGRVAMGSTVKAACAEHMVDYGKFYGWVLGDPLLKEEYELARTIQAEGMLDDMIELADEQGSGEVYIDSKGTAGSTTRPSSVRSCESISGGGTWPR